MEIETAAMDGSCSGDDNNNELAGGSSGNDGGWLERGRETL